MIPCPRCGYPGKDSRQAAAGRGKSEAKAKANRVKAAAYWADVRAGRCPAPRHEKRAP